MRILLFFAFSVCVLLKIAPSAQALDAQDMDPHAQMLPHDMMSAHQHSTGPADCGDMEVWDFSVAMCMPLPMAGMPMEMLMVHGNGFIVQNFEQGPRKQNALTAPDMFMADLGRSIGDTHYVNVDLMATLERWTYPDTGYPELLQIGEQDKNGNAFVDAQHPHSSPIMGLTFSDTISLEQGKDNLKLFFAPRGQSTDGPVAFMHRPTGMVNPDAPLGHHIGQDVGHISSTVAGAMLKLGSTTIETSGFHGTEPEPTKVDLPMGAINSYAARLTEEFDPHFYAMASAAYVKNPDSNDPTLDHVWRYSASLYAEHKFDENWTIHNALIYGLINYYDHTSALNSFAEEFWIHQGAKNIWGRIEYLQRTPEELNVPSTFLTQSKWVTAVTIGYTHKVAAWESGDIGLGGSITRDFLPGSFQTAYGTDTVSGKIFLQLSGMRMFNSF